MSLYFQETGAKNRETIVFLHGGGLAGWIWDEQVKAFPDYHSLVPDLPEHGKSAGVKPFTLEDAAAQVAHLVKKRGHGGKAHLVGLALGAQVILQILATAPEVVCDVLITGTLLHPPSATLQGLLDYTLKAYQPVKDTRFLIKANMRMYNISKSHFDQFQESMKEIKADSLARIISAHLFFTLPPGLEKVDVPVLVMAGEKDYKVIKDSAGELIRAIPHSEAYIVPNKGHAWNMESPELFNRVLRSFIEGDPLPDSIVGGDDLI
jgi:pimeloyl-ACP methyl ester carboxylesterase